MGKRRAEDLWVVGKDLTLDDGQGDSVTVFIRKMTPVDAKSATTRANAARARVRALRSDTDSDGYWELKAQVVDMESKVELIEYLILRPRLKIEQRFEAILRTTGEWAADDYIGGLETAWIDGLAETRILDPEDVEAARVWAELQRFAAMVAESADEEIDALRMEYEARSEDDLKDEAFRHVVGYEAENAWFDEFRLSQIFYGTRSAEDHNVRHFRDRKQFDNLSSKALQALRAAYDELEVDPSEGKESEETPTSSTSSESHPSSATGASSGLADALR